LEVVGTFLDSAHLLVCERPSVRSADSKRSGTGTHESCDLFLVLSDEVVVTDDHDATEAAASELRAIE